MQDVDVKVLISINLLELRSQKSFGRKIIKKLSNIINMVKVELAKNTYEIDLQNLKRNILVPIKDVHFNLEDLDIVILEDVEAYLLTLNEVEIDIAMRRWGFHQVVATLEEIGLSYKTSREGKGNLKLKLIMSCKISKNSPNHIVEQFSRPFDSRFTFKKLKRCIVVSLDLCLYIIFGNLFPT